MVTTFALSFKKVNVKTLTVFMLNFSKLILGKVDNGYGVNKDKIACTLSIFSSIPMSKQANYKMCKHNGVSNQ